MIVQECLKSGGWQEVKVPSATDPEIYYLITLPPWDRVEEEAVCECPSYKFRGHCRHQREALTMVCNWSELDGKEQSSSQKHDHICPECGGSTRTVMV